MSVRGGFVLAAILWEISLERAGPYLPSVGSALSMQPLSPLTDINITEGLAGIELALAVC